MGLERAGELGASSPPPWSWPASHSLASGRAGPDRLPSLYPVLDELSTDWLPGYEAGDSEGFAELVAYSSQPTATTESSCLVTGGRPYGVEVEDADRTSSCFSGVSTTSQGVGVQALPRDECLLGVAASPEDLRPAYERVPHWTRHGQRWHLLRVAPRGDHRRGGLASHPVLHTLSPSSHLSPSQVLLYDQMSSPEFRKGYVYLRRAFNK